LAEINRLPHFRAIIDGVGVHFLHFKERGSAPRALLLMNGWPSSFVEYRKLAPLLAEDFDVVIPALRGGHRYWRRRRYQTGTGTS